MSRTTPLAVLCAAVAIALLLATSAEAKRFKRYPDDVEKEKQEQRPDRKPAGKDQKPSAKQGPGKEPDAPPAAEAKPAEPGEGAGEKPEEAKDEEEDSEDEPAGGLFGTFLHGRDGWKAEYIYTGEVFTNMRGGIRTRDATKYLGLFDLAVTGELDEMGLFPGGTVFLLAEDSHGRGLTEDYVGDVQVLSNIDGERPFTQVSEYWWQRKLWDDSFTLRLGKQDANAEFAVVDLGGDFINSSFGLHHNIPMPSWPHPAMGAMTLFQLSEPLVLKLAVFDGAADGRTWGFSHTGDVFSVFELEGQWKLDKRLPGDCHVGLWYHSGTWDDVASFQVANGDSYRGLWYHGGLWSQIGARDAAAGPQVSHSGNHGVYMGLDQLIFKESDDEKDAQGLGLFAQYAWAVEDCNPVPNYVGGGLVYRGLLPNRDDDVTGIGVAHAIFSPELTGYRPETAIELFHKIQLSDFTVVQPDLQYIANPGGIHKDAFVFGLRYEVVF